MNSLFSFARHKSSIINSPVPIILLLLLCCIAGCRGGHPAEKEAVSYTHLTLPTIA